MKEALLIILLVAPILGFGQKIDAKKANIEMALGNVERMKKYKDEIRIIDPKAFEK